MNKWILLLCIIAVVGGQAVAFHRGWVLRGVRAAADEERALDGQAQGLRAQCDEEKRVTQEVSHEYQTNVADLRRQLAELKRVRAPAAACVPVAGAAGGRNAATGAGQPADPDGVRADWLYDFAAEAEEYRLRLMGCQSFVNKALGAARP